VDAGVEAELVDSCYCTICTYQVCCNDHDHWCWSARIAYQKVCHYPLLSAMIGELHIMNVWRMNGATVDEDFDRLLFGTSCSKLGPSGRGRPRSGKDLWVVESRLRTSLRWRVAPGWHGVEAAPW